MADFTLSDVSVVAVSLCKRGANGKRFFLKKMEALEDDEGVALIESKLLKADGSWSTVYSVVAEPGNEEKAGIAAGADPAKTDAWASEEEIRKASHSFMHSGGLINFQHANLDPVGRVVENFIAPADFKMLDPSGAEQHIKKGAWVIGIQPNDDLRGLIDAGEIDSVSYEGTGVRTPVAKADPSKGSAYRKCGGCGAKMSYDAGKCKNCGKTYVAKRVGPGGDIARNQGVQNGPLKNLIKFYLKKPHPFTSCVRDNRKRFGSRAENVCAALKDIGLQTTHWRKGSKKLAKSEDIPQPLLDSVHVAWTGRGLTDDDASLALEGLMEDQDRSLLHKIAASMGLAKCGDDCDCGSTSEEEDVPLTDQEKAALAKVEGIESAVDTLANKVNAYETKLDTLLSRVAAPEPTDDEKRDALMKSVDTLTAGLATVQEQLGKLSEGSSSQGNKDQLQKSNDPDRELALALFG